MKSLVLWLKRAFQALWSYRGKDSFPDPSISPWLKEQLSGQLVLYEQGMIESGARALFIGRFAHLSRQGVRVAAIIHCHTRKQQESLVGALLMTKEEKS